MSFTSWPNENWEFRERQNKIDKGFVKFYRILIGSSLLWFCYDIIMLLTSPITIARTIMPFYWILVLLYFRRQRNRLLQKITIYEMEKQFNG